MLILLSMLELVMSYPVYAFAREGEEVMVGSPHPYETFNTT
jgi:hypothetical protein